MVGRALNVLLIEDDVGDAILVERKLQNCQQPFSIRHAECLEDAINYCRDDDFDVALLDLSLPDSQGLSTMDRLRDVTPDLPIVVLTGLSDDVVALQSLEQGAQDYLIKCNATTELLERTLRYAIQRQQIQTENRRLLHRMEELVSQDPLTGVLNRHSFSESLEREWRRANRHHRELTCVVLDIDFFKRVNDNFGHAMGDQALIQVANTLCDNSRTGDYVGRLGGEEFCVLLPETNEKGALVWAERARAAIADLVVSGADELRITASFGIASHRKEIVKPQSLVDHADEAMFVAKQLGRDQVVSFDRLRDLDRQDQSRVWNGVRVTEIMSPLVDSFTACQSIREAMRVFQTRQVDSVAVLDTAGNLVGVLGEDDIMAVALTSNVFERTVGDLMQTQFVTYPSAATAREVCEFLCRVAVRQVFITDELHPVGVIRRGNLLHWLSKSINRYEAAASQPFTERVHAIPVSLP